MQLVELLDKAKAGYAKDGFLGEYYDSETGAFNPDGEGDSLARFIAVELEETFNPERPDYRQIEDAKRAIRQAMLELSCVYDALRL